MKDEQRVFPQTEDKQIIHAVKPPPAEPPGCPPRGAHNIFVRWGFGMRTMKTALAVFICLVLDLLLEHGQPINACIAAILTMQATERDSFHEGRRRLLGTVIGGLIGMGTLYLRVLMPHPLLGLVLTTLGVMLAISICCIIHNPQAAAFTAIVVLGLALQMDTNDTYVIALWQLAETAVGVMVAVMVNHFIAPPGVKRHRALHRRIKAAQKEAAKNPGGKEEASS